MSDVCGTCKAQVVWALTPTGAKAPIDREPAETGNVLLLAPTGFGQPLAVTLSQDGLEHARAQAVPLRLSHWATCPDKQEWRERTDAKERD